MPSHPVPKNPRPHATPEEIARLRAEIRGEVKAEVRPDPYREARETLSKGVDELIAATEARLTTLTQGTEDVDALRAVYRSLLTVQQRAKRAVANIPDSAIPLETTPELEGESANAA